MSKKDKLWKKANNNPQNLTFTEFETLLSQCGWEFSRQTGSPKVFGILPIINLYQFNRKKTEKLKFIK